uniref:Uncharacterized protein n=1 Tax=Populus trichocarpa TaxID=3694 RepID=A0A2K2CD80_POPTR
MVGLNQQIRDAWMMFVLDVCIRLVGTYVMINSTLVGSNSSCFICYNNLSYFMCLLCELPEIRVMSCV